MATELLLAYTYASTYISGKVDSVKSSVSSRFLSVEQLPQDAGRFILAIQFFYCTDKC